jgi:hypothetical protein
MAPTELIQENYMNSISKYLKFGLFIALIFLNGCAGPGYKQAFSTQTALNGNTKHFMNPADQTVKAVKQTLVKQGFTIDASGSSADIIKANRIMQEKEDSKISYNIQLSVVVSEDVTGRSSNVSVGASQQTILHKKWHTWWHLLWIIPIIPTGTQHQTVVTSEGNVDDPTFYNDFFTGLEKTLLSLSLGTEQANVT